MLREFLTSGAIVSLPEDQLLIGWGEHQWSKKCDLNPEIPAFYFSDFFLTKEKPWLHYRNWKILSIEECLSHLGEEKTSFGKDWVIEKLGVYESAFHDLLQRLQKGELKKAVPYLFVHAPLKMSESPLRHALVHGISSLKKGRGSLYGYWNTSFGLLGVTPEVLFSHSESRPRVVETMALAGTCSASCSDSLLLQSQKERREHALVIQGICEALKLMGRVEVGASKVISLPPLSHLMTPIQLHLNHSFNFESLVSALHPTPALGAFPVKEGRQWLADYQQSFPRGYYGAPLGFICSQQGLSCCFVGIRNMQWDTKEIRIGAGGGVVQESVFENEWEEIQLKIRAIKELFSL